jgi:hypothetical protein
MTGATRRVALLWSASAAILQRATRLAPQ